MLWIIICVVDGTRYAEIAEEEGEKTRKKAVSVYIWLSATKPMPVKYDDDAYTK